MPEEELNFTIRSAEWRKKNAILSPCTNETFRNELIFNMCEGKWPFGTSVCHMKNLICSEFAPRRFDFKIKDGGGIIILQPVFKLIVTVLLTFEELYCYMRQPIVWNNYNSFPSPLFPFLEGPARPSSFYCFAAVGQRRISLCPGRPVQFYPQKDRTRLFGTLVCIRKIAQFW